VQDEGAIAAAVGTVLVAHGRIDVLVHDAGHRAYGPSEAFTPGRLGQADEVHVLGRRRVNRAVLPHMRAPRSGKLV
jgi:NADP-dependent 3-hydroxy acid dehydrogenase YdfG